MLRVRALAQPEQSQYQFRLRFDEEPAAFAAGRRIAERQADRSWCSGVGEGLTNRLQSRSSMRSGVSPSCRYSSSVHGRMCWNAATDMGCLPVEWSADSFT